MENSRLWNYFISYEKKSQLFRYLVFQNKLKSKSWRQCYKLLTTFTKLIFFENFRNAMLWEFKLGSLLYDLIDPIGCQEEQPQWKQSIHFTANFVLSNISKQAEIFNLTSSFFKFKKNFQKFVSCEVFDIIKMPNIFSSQFVIVVAKSSSPRWPLLKGAELRPIGC